MDWGGQRGAHPCDVDAIGDDTRPACALGHWAAVVHSSRLWPACAPRIRLGPAPAPNLHAAAPQHPPTCTMPRFRLLWRWMIAPLLVGSSSPGCPGSQDSSDSSSSSTERFKSCVGGGSGGALAMRPKRLPHRRGARPFAGHASFGGCVPQALSPGVGVAQGAAVFGWGAPASSQQTAR
jgi:hypothetical protein